MNTYILHTATSIGAITQWRSFGGAIGLAAVTSVMISSLNDSLSHELTPAQRYGVLQSAAAIDALPVSLQQLTRFQFAKSYDVQMRIVVGLAVAQFLVTLLMLMKKDLGR
jgi:hypothetical protein